MQELRREGHHLEIWGLSACYEAEAVAKGTWFICKCWEIKSGYQPKLKIAEFLQDIFPFGLSNTNPLPPILRLPANFRLVYD